MRRALGTECESMRMSRLMGPCGLTPMAYDSVQRLNQLAKRAKKLDDVIQKAAKMQKQIVEKFVIASTEVHDEPPKRSKPVLNEQAVFVGAEYRRARQTEDAAHDADAESGAMPKQDRRRARTSPAA